MAKTSLITALTAAGAILFSNAINSYAAQVQIAWDPNNPSPHGYKVFKREAGKEYNYASPAWNGTSTNAFITGLEENIKYYFVVRAFIDSNESGNSNEISYTPKATEPAAHPPYNMEVSKKEEPKTKQEPKQIAEFTTESNIEKILQFASQTHNPQGYDINFYNIPKHINPNGMIAYAIIPRENNLRRQKPQYTTEIV